MTAKARVCGVMGDGDVCGAAKYHKGDHAGAHTGRTWPNTGPTTQKQRENQSRDASIAEESRETTDRNRPPPPRKFGSRRWFGDRE